MNATTASHDRALIRRYAFLGLPGERQGGMSFAELRAELGDENTNHLVTRIGALAQVHHLDQSRVPLGDVVARIMQSLTPDERRSIAQGNAIPPRIEAMMSAEAETAKATAAQAEAARHNPSGAPLSAAVLAAAGYGGLGRYAQANTGTMSDAGGGVGAGGSANAANAVAAGPAGTIGAAAASAGVSPQTMGHYMREYSGMGFDQRTIATFAKVGLGARDERGLERRWGREEVVKGAGTANEFGWRGKQAVGDVTAISDQEREALRRLGRAQTPEEKEKIKTEIRALPPRRGESKEDKRKRDDRNFRRMDSSHADLRAKAGDQAARDAETNQLTTNAARDGNAATKNEANKADSRIDAFMGAAGTPSPTPSAPASGGKVVDASTAPGTTGASLTQPGAVPAPNAPASGRKVVDAPTSPGTTTGASKPGAQHAGTPGSTTAEKPKQVVSAPKSPAPTLQA
jgi:hypothetical protein